MRWITGDTPFAARLVAFTAIEGISLFGSLASIYWLKNRGLVPGRASSNELIFKDGGPNTDFARLLSKHLVHKTEGRIMHDIIHDAVSIEQEFMTSVLATGPSWYQCRVDEPVHRVCG